MTFLKRFFRICVNGHKLSIFNSGHLEMDNINRSVRSLAWMSPQSYKQEAFLLFAQHVSATCKTPVGGIKTAKISDNYTFPFAV